MVDVGAAMMSAMPGEPQADLDAAQRRIAELAALARERKAATAGPKNPFRMVTRLPTPLGQDLRSLVDGADARLARARRQQGVRALGGGEALREVFEEARITKNLQRQTRGLAKLGPIWAEMVPPALLRHTALASYNRGVLTVHVASSAALFDLQRLLAGGLEHRIRRAFTGGTLSRIKLLVVPFDDRAET